MRYGLLALSLTMLASGAIAAQSALAISDSASVTLASAPSTNTSSASHGSLPYTAARGDGLH